MSVFRIKQHRPRAGFTLVEVMVTVLIIGIILAVAMPSLAKARQTAQGKGCQANLKQIVGSKERWAMDNNRGPSDAPTMLELAVPGVYMKGTPICPGGGSYTINPMSDLPTCSIGGDVSSSDSHVFR